MARTQGEWRKPHGCLGWSEGSAPAACFGGVSASLSWPHGPASTLSEPQEDRVSQPTIYDVQIADLHGKPLDLAQFRGIATLVVNVASRCGLTPQYAVLEEVHERYADQGFSVLGAPCNQFGGQEPGTAE